MQGFLLQIAQGIMGFMGGTHMLGSSDQFSSGKDGTKDVYERIFEPIVNILNSMLPYILILLGTAGSIYAIVLGVNFSKAESADKREEAKKRMINAIIGLVVTMLLLVLLYLFTQYAHQISAWIQSFGNSPADSSK